MHGRTTTRAAVLLLLVSLMGLPQARAQAPDTPGREKPAAAPKAKEANGEEDKDKNGDDKDEKKDKEEEKPKWYSAHAQGTIISQGNGSFRSPYFGPNSLIPGSNYRTSETATLYLAGRLWDNGEIVFDPEVAGGLGISRTLGLAGFANGDITRVGKVEPTPYIARFFYRHTFELGGEQEKVEDEPNQVAGMRDVSRITISIGKFAATDLAD